MESSVFLSEYRAVFRDLLVFFCVRVGVQPLLVSLRRDERIKKGFQKLEIICLYINNGRTAKASRKMVKPSLINLDLGDLQKRVAFPSMQHVLNHVESPGYEL